MVVVATVFDVAVCSPPPSAVAWRGCGVRRWRWKEEEEVEVENLGLEEVNLVDLLFFLSLSPFNLSPLSVP